MSKYDWMADLVERDNARGYVPEPVAPAPAVVDDFAEFADQWWPGDGSDYLMALRHPGKRATKQHTWTGDGWHTEARAEGYRFDCVPSAPIRNLQELGDALKAIEREPEWLVVRGEPESTETRQRRVYLNDGPFKPTDRRWLCIDVDEIDGSHVSEAIAALPDYVQRAGCWYQYSSSYGVKLGKVKVHLWYWLDRPACCFSLRQWAKSLGGLIDAMLYNPVQPHFTAAPVFVGAPDPVAQRSGFWPGEPELVLPASVVDLATYRAEEKQRLAAAEEWRRKAAQRASRNPRADDQRQFYALKALERAVDAILSAGPGSRHLTIYRESCSMGGLAAYVDIGAIRSTLEQAACVAYAGENRDKEALRVVTEGIDVGLKQPRDLSHIGSGLDPKLIDEFCAMFDSKNE